MPKVTFTGFVVPSGVLKQAGRGPLLPQDPGLPNLSVTYAITDSSVVVDCELDHLDANSIGRLHLWVYILAREIVDVVSFTQGVGLTLILENCTLPDGTSKPLLSSDQALQQLCTISNNEIIAVAEKERGILKHIHDLTSTLSHPLEIPVNCGRAIEGLSKLISPTADAKGRWETLRHNLNLTRDYVQLISDLSTNPRHGDIGPQSMPRLFEVRNRAWIIMNRFLHFRKGGSVQLEISDFPLL
jgi:hypothetical protein